MKFIGEYWEFVSVAGLLAIALWCLGFSLCYRSRNVINLSLIACGGSCALLYVILTKLIDAQGAMLLALVVAAVSALILGELIEFSCVRPWRHMPTVVATFMLFGVGVTLSAAVPNLYALLFGPSVTFIQAPSLLGRHGTTLVVVGAFFTIGCGWLLIRRWLRRNDDASRNDDSGPVFGIATMCITCALLLNMYENGLISAWGMLDYRLGLVGLIGFFLSGVSMPLVTFGNGIIVGATYYAVRLAFHYLPEPYETFRDQDLTLLVLLAIVALVHSPKGVLFRRQSEGSG